MKRLYLLRHAKAGWAMPGKLFFVEPGTSLMLKAERKNLLLFYVADSEYRSISVHRYRKRRRCNGFRKKAAQHQATVLFVQIPN